MKSDEDWLRQALSEGNIPINDENIAALYIGIQNIIREYRIHKVATQKSAIGILVDDLSKIHKSAVVMASIFDAHLSSLFEIEIILAGFGFDSIAFADQLHRLSNAAEQACFMAEAEAAKTKSDMRRHKQEPETWLFLALHDLYEELVGKKPGIAGPLYRFTCEQCAPLISPDIAAPNTEDAFRKRMTAALRRRTGKITVFPRVIFPWKEQEPETS
jgi:hypothetical protein